jgi:hypothetical protein
MANVALESTNLWQLKVRLGQLSELLVPHRELCPVVIDLLIQMSFSLQTFRRRRFFGLDNRLNRLRLVAKL